MEWTGPDHPPKVNGQTLSSTLAQATQKKYTVKQPPEDPRTSEIIWMPPEEGRDSKSRRSEKGEREGKRKNKSAVAEIAPFRVANRPSPSGCG